MAESDHLDRRLIALLKENARRPTSELARQLGVSRSTIQGRILRLERQQIIRQFTIELGAQYQQRLIEAHVLVKLDQSQTGTTQSNLAKIPAVTALYSVSGEYDLIVEIAAESTSELDALLDQIGSIEGIQRTNSSVILDTKFKR